MDPEQENSDVKTTESSTVNDETSTSSVESTEQSSAKEETTEDSIQAIVERGLKGTQPDTETEQKPESEVSETNQTEGEQKDKVETKTTESEQKKEDEDKGPVPYERFAEVNTKAKEFETKVKDLEPFARAQNEVIQFCQQHGVTAEEYREAVFLAAYRKTNPEEFAKRIAPWVDQAKQFTGDTLPADLQKQVDDGEIPLEFAKRLAKAENANKFGTQQLAQTREQQEAQNRQQWVNQLGNDLNAFVTSKQGNDPDFQPKGKADDADGKYELFQLKLSQLINPQSVKSSADLIALATRAYQEVSRTFQRFTPANNGHKTVPSRRSSPTQKKELTSIAEAVKAGFAKHGIEVETQE